MNKEVERQLSLEPKRWVKVLCSTIVLAIILIPCIMQIDWEGINAGAGNVVNKIINGIFHPDMAFATNLSDTGLLNLMLQTLAIGFLGTLIGAVIALPLSFLASTNISNKIISNIFSFIIISIRTFPLYVYAVVFIKIVGPNALCGVLTIAITSVGMIAKMFIEAIEEVDPQLLASADSLGFNIWQKCRYVIFNQLQSSFISTTIYRFDINLKNSTVLGLVGAGGIGTAINTSISADNWSKFGTILITLVVLILIVDLISSKIRKSLA